MWKGSAAASFFSNDLGGMQLLGPHMRQALGPGGEAYAKLKASETRGHRPSAEDIERFAGDGLVSESAWRGYFGVPISSVRLGGAREEDEAPPEAATVAVRKRREKIRVSKPAAETEPAEKPSQADQSAPRASDVDEPPAAAAAKPHAYAVVIGIGKYRRKLPNADFADQDASAVAKYLRVLGYPDANVATLINEEASKGDFEKYFERWLPNHAEAGSEIFVYYSGARRAQPQDGRRLSRALRRRPDLYRRDRLPAEENVRAARQAARQEDHGRHGLVLLGGGRALGDRRRSAAAGQRRAGRRADQYHGDLRLGGRPDSRTATRTKPMGSLLIIF